MAGLLENQLAEMLRCDICFEDNERKRMLLCQHSFCLTCLSQLPVKNNMFKCPVCCQVRVLPAQRSYRKWGIILSYSADGRPSRGPLRGSRRQSLASFLWFSWFFLLGHLDVLFNRVPKPEACWRGRSYCRNYLCSSFATRRSEWLGIELEIFPSQASRFNHQTIELSPMHCIVCLWLYMFS